MKKILLACGLLISSFATVAADLAHGADNFYKSDKVIAKKVTFLNQYKMKITGNLYIPKGVQPNVKSPAIVVGPPMGAVKEQSASFYAQKMAEQGFVTLAIDLSFFGESEGSPRNAVLPDMFTESFNAAVDYLGTRPFVDRNGIGVIGICGSGSFAISAAKIDPRLKAIATVSMYNMGAVTRHGLHNGISLEQRKAMIAAAAEQRYVEFTGGKTKWVDYLPVKLPADADPIRREFYDFYRTTRGQVVPAGMTVEQSQNRPISSEVKFNNFYPFADIESISPRPMLFITGSEAHSREFSEDAYKRAGQPKELVIIPGAGHVDLYDRTQFIPFTKLTEFFKKNLK
ncbi:alpha/beta hydrolase [Rosenbergiella epipactidis]|uniref:alpha/beta hydrolase n=1 Tax=Rosenbergiella epipactidis TaxID=1544694 RepID=UPI001F4EC379|nr:alpha/beta hydrolase [Rosenbergiella epipactidis]